MSDAALRLAERSPGTEAHAVALARVGRWREASLALAALQDCGDLPAAREYHHEATLLATVAEALNLPPPRI